MSENLIKIEALISKERDAVWDCYTSPSHIVNWNFASDDWCCPTANNNLEIGGKYHARMEAKDGSFAFDFIATYSQIDHGHSFTYQMDDGRNVAVVFQDQDNSTLVNIEFEAEKENPADMQQQGWQAILNNFKRYCESL